MVRKSTKMKGILLNPEVGHVYINESYEKFLTTMYGKKFPSHFLAMVNDLLDSGILETLDDMKKVIKYFEWRLEQKEEQLEKTRAREEELDKSLLRMMNYALELERRLGQPTEDEIVPSAAAGIADSDLVSILERLHGKDTARESEAPAADSETGPSALAALPERPPEMEAISSDAHEGRLAGRLGESEIGADEIELTPAVMRIVDKIETVKEMEALHSDEEIDRLFKEMRGKNRKSP